MTTRYIDKNTGVVLSEKQIIAQQKRKRQAELRAGRNPIINALDLVKKKQRQQKRVKKEIFRGFKKTAKFGDEFSFGLSELKRALELKKGLTRKNEILSAINDKLTPVERQELITAIRAELKEDKRKGNVLTAMELAHLQNMTQLRYEKLVKSIAGVKLSALKTRIESQAKEERYDRDENDEIEKKASILRGWITVQGDDSFKLRCKYADPIISNPKKDFRSRLYPPRKDGGTGKADTDWSNEMKIFGDDRYIQPVKRLRIAGHSFIHAFPWYVRDRLKLMPYTTKLADNDLDKYLTHEGGIIISSKFAEQQHKNIGDKLLGVNGLKGIICEVRSMNPSLIISKNQIWDEKKLSRMCGGAVLELKETNQLKIFNAYHLNVSGLAFRDKRASFGPDLVPFLSNYLPKEELESIIGNNSKRFCDFLHMINYRWFEEDGQLVFRPNLEQPDLTRKGGYAREWGHSLWGKVTKEPYLEDNGSDYYPFVMEKIWIPSWFEEAYSDKVEGPNREIKGLLEGPTPKGEKSKDQWNIGKHMASIMHKLVFGTISNSASGLIATQKDGDPYEVLLSKKVGEQMGWKNGNTVLVYRNPVIAKRNIQQMKVKLENRPENTIGINIECLRKMSGDTDGDTLSLIRTEGGEVFRVSQEELTKEREKITEEIKEQDTPLPTDKQEIQIAQRIAFIKSVPYLKGRRKLPVDPKTEEKRLESFQKELPTLEKNDEIRTDNNLIEEADIEHRKMNLDQSRTTKVGILSKAGWLATSDENMVIAIGALEAMKDRPAKMGKDEYADAVKILKDYSETLKTTYTHKGKVSDPHQPEEIRTMIRFLSQQPFKKDAPEPVNINQLRHGKGLGKANNAYAKWILALSR